MRVSFCLKYIANDTSAMTTKNTSVCINTFGVSVLDAGFMIA